MIGWRWPRGTICVVREVNGRLCVLRLQNQQAFREWAGCFSIIGDTP